MSYINGAPSKARNANVVYIYGPTFGNAETVSFYLLHNVSTLNQCREVSCVTFVCKHFAREPKHFYYFLFPWRNSSQWCKTFSLSKIHDHTQKHHTRQDSSGRGISPSTGTLPDNTQHSQQTAVYATGNPRKRPAADQRLRQCSHRDLLTSNIFYKVN